MPTHPYQIMPPHPHHSIKPNLYSSITPHQVCLCPYCTYAPKYTPYVVPHYSYIPPLGDIHTSNSRLPSSVLPPHPPKR